MHIVLLIISLLPLPHTSAEETAVPEGKMNTIEKMDWKVRLFARSHQSEAGDRFFELAKFFGEWKLYAAASAVMYVEDERSGELALKGGLIAGVATETIRHTVDRIRPRKHGDPRAYHPTKGNAFSSGHASSAFALATALDENYGVGYVTYPIAAMTALSRLYHDAHWLSDTLMGAGIGVASVKAVALHDEDGTDVKEGSGMYAEAFGAYTVADLAAFQLEKGPARTALRLAAVGFVASRVDDEAELYGAFAGIATSVLVTRGFKKLKGLQFGPASVSFAWEW